MNHNYCSKKSVFSKVLSLILALVLLLASYTIANEVNKAHAETVYATEYILCKDYVIIRQWANRHATEVGQLDPGDEIEIDGKTKDGFAHIVSPTDGWVWAGNIVFSPVEKVDRLAYVTARKRLAARRWVDGPNVESKPWLITGSEVRVYYMDSEWAVTNRGYLKVEYLEVEEGV